MQRSLRSTSLAFFTLVLVATLASAATAQASPPLKIPQDSPAATSSLDVGVTTLTVSYHRPALRGRDPWKELGDPQTVWRLGANEATTLAFTDPVTIAGKTLPAGTYALFARVGKEQWTFLVNKAAQQWGSYFYDEKQDVLHFDAKVDHLAADAKREWFTITLDPTTQDAATLTVTWADVKVAFPIQVDVDGIVAKRIEKALKDRTPKDWETLLAVTKYWCTRKERLEEAYKLIDEALSIEANPWTCEWKGRVLHELGEDEPAIPLIERAIELCKGTNFPEGYRAGLRVFRKQLKGERP